jgi:D-psicose/D-tagatose/L-ribulose 3-epimerase
MKYGIHSFVWSSDSSQRALEHAIASTAECGYDLIEWSYLDPKSVDIGWFRRRLESAGLEAVVSMGLPPEGDIASEDADKVARGEEILDAAVAFTRDIGGRKLGGILSSAHGKQERQPSAKGRDNAIAVLRRVAGRAKEAGVSLNLEIVNRFESNLLNTAAQGRALIEEAGSDNLFLHLDVFHMNIEEAGIDVAIRANADRLGYVHIGESHRGYLGTGNIDFPCVFDALVDIGYDDIVTFESFSSEIVDADLSLRTAIWRNMWSDSRKLAEHGLRFMREAHNNALAKAELARGSVSG